MDEPKTSQHNYKKKQSPRQHQPPPQALNSFKQIFLITEFRTQLLTLKLYSERMSTLQRTFEAKSKQFTFAAKSKARSSFKDHLQSFTNDLMKMTNNHFRKLLKYFNTVFEGLQEDQEFSEELRMRLKEVQMMHNSTMEKIFNNDNLGNVEFCEESIPFFFDISGMELREFVEIWSHSATKIFEKRKIGELMISAIQEDNLREVTTMEDVSDLAELHSDNFFSNNAKNEQNRKGNSLGGLKPSEADEANSGEKKKGMKVLEGLERPQSKTVGGFEDPLKLSVLDSERRGSLPPGNSGFKNMLNTLFGGPIDHKRDKNLKFEPKSQNLKNRISSQKKVRKMSRLSHNIPVPSSKHARHPRMILSVQPSENGWAMLRLSKSPQSPQKRLNLARSRSPDHPRLTEEVYSSVSNQNSVHQKTEFLDEKTEGSTERLIDLAHLGAHGEPHSPEKPSVNDIRIEECLEFEADSDDFLDLGGQERLEQTFGKRSDLISSQLGTSKELRTKKGSKVGKLLLDQNLFQNDYKSGNDPKKGSKGSQEASKQTRKRSGGVEFIPEKYDTIEEFESNSRSVTMTSQEMVETEDSQAYLIGSLQNSGSKTAKSSKSSNSGSGLRISVERELEAEKGSKGREKGVVVGSEASNQRGSMESAQNRYKRNSGTGSNSTQNIYNPPSSMRERIKLMGNFTDFWRFLSTNFFHVF